MKKQVSVAFFVVAFLWLGAVPFAQVDADIKKELDAQYRRLAEAHDRKDLKAIASLKTPDFYAILPDGKVADVKLMEQNTKQFLEVNQPPFDIRFTIKQLSVSDNKLIAVAEVFQEASRFRDLAGKRRKVETSVLQRETWSKTSDGWKLRCVDNVRDAKRFVDGKRVDPGKPYDPSAPPFDPKTEK